MKDKKNTGAIKNKANKERLAAGIAALVVAGVCVSVYFGARVGNGSDNYLAPDGVAFAAPDASGGNMYIDDGPVPLADTLVAENDESDDFGELFASEDVLDGNDDSQDFGGDLLSDEETDNNNEDMLTGELIEDTDNSDKGSKDSDNKSNDSDKKSDKSNKDADKSEENKKDSSDQDKKDSSKSDSSSVAAIDNMMLKKINELRASTGAGKLTIDPQLCEYATIRAQEASVNWSHTRPNGSQGCDMISSSKYRAENLSCRTYSSFGYTQNEQEKAAAAMFDNLKASSMHYENMTFKNFTKVGIKTYVSKTSDGKTRLTTAYLFSN